MSVTSYIIVSNYGFYYPLPARRFVYIIAWVEEINLAQILTSRQMQLGDVPYVLALFVKHENGLL